MGRLRRKQGVIATYFPGKQGPELEKDTAKPLHDQKEAIEMEMLQGISPNTQNS